VLTQEEALRILGREKEYEEQLVVRLYDYFISSIGQVSGISHVEAEQIRKTLENIASDSQGHSYEFNMLMQMVLENGEDKY
jgi:hypothetical protein